MVPPVKSSMAPQLDVQQLTMPDCNNGKKSKKRQPDQHADGRGEGGKRQRFTPPAVVIVDKTEASNMSSSLTRPQHPDVHTHVPTP